VRHALEFPSAACGEIEGPGLIAADNPSGMGSGAESGTAKPAVRAKFPPLVIGTTTGTFVTRLNGSGETTSTGRRPFCS
jgi:hypothetical protein